MKRYIDLGYQILIIINTAISYSSEASLAYSKSLYSQDVDSIR